MKILSNLQTYVELCHTMQAQEQSKNLSYKFSHCIVTEQVIYFNSTLASG